VRLLPGKPLSKRPKIRGGSSDRIDWIRGGGLGLVQEEGGRVFWREEPGGSDGSVCASY
jgi:hypothetical protein